MELIRDVIGEGVRFLLRRLAGLRDLRVVPLAGVLSGIARGLPQDALATKEIGNAILRPRAISLDGRAFARGFIMRCFVRLGRHVRLW